MVTVADACPTCQNANSLDLSIGAFDAIANRADGLVPSECGRVFRMPHGFADKRSRVCLFVLSFVAFQLRARIVSLNQITKLSSAATPIACV